MFSDTHFQESYTTLKCSKNPSCQSGIHSSHFIDSPLFLITLFNVYSVHLGMFSTSGGCLEYIGDVQYTGGYHDLCGGASWQKSFIYIENPDVLNIPDVLMISPHMHHDIPPNVLDIPDVLMIIPPTCIMISPDVLIISPTCIMISPRCTLGIPRCTEHTLYRVLIQTRQQIFTFSKSRDTNETNLKFWQVRDSWGTGSSFL